MVMVTMKELLEAGAHFGHRKGAWNPKMKPYIYQERNQMHILDLTQTVKKVAEACEFVRDLAAEGKKILFVGTKRQAKRCIEEEAKRCNSSYINSRWLGGFLTNFPTIKKRIEKLSDLESQATEDLWEKLPKKEEMVLRRELEKLERNLNGVREMNELPEAIYITDVKVDETAVKEARKLAIPVIGIVDSNNDPNLVDYLVPANDDAIKSIKLITAKIADAILEGSEILQKKEEMERKEEIEEEVEEIEGKAKELVKEAEEIKKQEAEKARKKAKKAEITKITKETGEVEKKPEKSEKEVEEIVKTEEGEEKIEKPVKEPEKKVEEAKEKAKKEIVEKAEKVEKVKKVKKAKKTEEKKEKIKTKKTKKTKKIKKETGKAKKEVEKVEKKVEVKPEEIIEEKSEAGLEKGGIKPKKKR